MNSNYLTNSSPTAKQSFLRRRRIDVNSCKRRVAKYLILQKQGVIMVSTATLRCCNECRKAEVELRLSTIK